MGNQGSFIHSDNANADKNVSLEEAAKAAIINDSIHKNMLIVKLEMVRAWMSVYPQFNRVLNQSHDYGAPQFSTSNAKVFDDDTAWHQEDDDEENEENKNKESRGMYRLWRLGNKLYSNCHATM